MCALARLVDPSSAPPKCVDGPGLVWVGARHQHRHAAVAWAGAALARELQYQRLFPLEIWKRPGWREAFVYVVDTPQGRRAVGAGACRLPFYPHLPEELRELVFVYFHPDFRRHGLLDEVWPQLISRWGPFVIQAPLSEAMLRFAERHAYHELFPSNGGDAVMVFGRLQSLASKVLRSP